LNPGPRAAPRKQEETMAENGTIAAELERIVGAGHVITDAAGQRFYTTGYRFGGGAVAAVVRPGTLIELWRVFQSAVRQGAIVIMQAANTGLNGGSTPFGDGYDRPIVLINCLRIDRIDLLGEGTQVLCLPGARLHSLEKQLAPLGRDPHSVIGSTTIGATVAGGVSNNSGGALVRRGPAYTQLALFARVNEAGEPELINNLGIDLGDTPEEILGRLDRGEYQPADVRWDHGRLASDPDYAHIVRRIDEPTPARYNNDPRLLHGPSGSSGKVCTFALRLDTFARTGQTAAFYIGADQHTTLNAIRRHILSEFPALPIAGEYMNRDAHRIAEAYGKDLYLFLKHAGPDRILHAFRAKAGFDALTARIGLGTAVSDRLLQLLVKLLPPHLPKRIREFGERYEHHFILRVDGDNIARTRDYLTAFFAANEGGFFECDAAEADAAFRHRYAMGGAAIRYRAVHAGTVENIVAIDVAMPRNAEDWRDNLPESVRREVVQRFPTGHFLCHAFHYDYAIRKGANWQEIEDTLVRHFSERGAEVPSEHNVGHMYQAKPALVDHFRTLDPTNTLNPGVGGTSKKRNWA
jgi:D-lactate dehydrogenase